MTPSYNSVLSLTPCWHVYHRVILRFPSVNFLPDSPKPFHHSFYSCIPHSFRSSRQVTTAWIPWFPKPNFQYTITSIQMGGLLIWQGEGWTWVSLRADFAQYKTQRRTYYSHLHCIMGMAVIPGRSMRIKGCGLGSRPFHSEMDTIPLPSPVLVADTSVQRQVTFTSPFLF